MLGIVMILAAFITKTDNNFISSFGLAMTIIGIARIVNYRAITKDEETIRKRQIMETDERNISIMYKSKSTAFGIYAVILGAAVIVLSFMGMHEAAKWIAYSECLLVTVYWISYFIYRKKL